MTRQVMQWLPSNTSARIERCRVGLTELERVEVPDEVEAYRAGLLEVLKSMDVGLPDLLMEVGQLGKELPAMVTRTGDFRPVSTSG